MKSLRRNDSVILLLFSFAVCYSFAGKIPSLVPGDKAPSFTLETKSSPLIYDVNSAKFKGCPFIFTIFTNESCFLESIFSRPRELFMDLFERSPDNAHYVFIFQDVVNAFKGANTGEKLTDEFQRAALYYSVRKRQAYRKYRELSPSVTPTRRHKRFATGPMNKNLNPNQFLNHWKERLHFASFPVHKLGNWIPRLISQWSCTGMFCGYDQIAIENQQGSVLSVFRRLDARYSWLPSIKTLTAQYRRLQIVNVGDACLQKFATDVRGRLALVSLENGTCSVFTKIKNAQANGALGVIAYAPHSGMKSDLNCHGKECEQQLTIPATLIHSDSGHKLSLSVDLFARFQTTPGDAFVFGIDGQGRVQQTDWFLYPSVRFLAHQAQWFDYLTDSVYNESGNARVIKIFGNGNLQGVQGISSVVTIPPYHELQLYRNVELDMSVSCPGTGPDACTHWDHVIRLFVSCNSSGEKPGPELGRWIMAFKRRSSHWITPVTSLLPLLKCGGFFGRASCKCNFTVKTEAWVMPWTVRLEVRLSDKMKRNVMYPTYRSVERTLVPSSKTHLFAGRLFDENYNKDFKPKQFTIPPRTARVKLVATITGHGRDNNNCAGACITSHNFVVNGNHTNTRIYKNARSARGCMDRKVEGITRNDLHAAWLFGREAWCDGQEVVPWEVDITDQIRRAPGINTIQYHGWFNGTDPQPTQDPGTILMSSYIVYYEFRDVV